MYIAVTDISNARLTARAATWGKALPIDGPADPAPRIPIGGTPFLVPLDYLHTYLHINLTGVAPLSCI